MTSQRFERSTEAVAQAWNRLGVSPGAWRIRNLLLTFDCELVLDELNRLGVRGDLTFELLWAGLVARSEKQREIKRASVRLKGAR